MSSITRRRFLQASGPLAAMSAMTRKSATAAAAVQADMRELPRVRQRLVDPPFVPKHTQVAASGPRIWEQGSFSDPPAHGLETWFIRGGSAGAAIYTFRQPGIYAYLNHNLIKAVELGALAHVKVEGKWDDDLMTQVAPPGPIGGAKAPPSA